MKHFLTTIILLLALVPASYAQLAPPPPYYGTNPSVSDIKAIFLKYGFTYHVPPQILFGIAQTESSGWKQYYDTNDDGQGHGRTVFHQEPNGSIGVGIMQITVFPNDPDYHNLCTSIDHNIEVGVQKLVAKWGSTPVIGDGLGNVGREKLENWYYAVWAYNGWGYLNNPNNKNTPAPYTAKATVYQDTVYYYIANNEKCPASLAGMWVDCAITPPTNAEIGSITTGATHGCGQPIANTPTPIHVDANFDGVIDGTTGGGSSTDIYVDGNFTGTQSGTASNPYATLTAAINAADANLSVTIHIAPNWYKEKISTSKHIHFVTNGSGTVRIGG